MGQGQAVLYTGEETSFTNPDLHRRIDNEVVLPIPHTAPNTYTLSIQGVNSYRTTEQHFHDEESTTSEIP